VALNDDTGTVDWQKSTDVAYAIGGALLMDLALGGRIESGQAGRERRPLNWRRATGFGTAVARKLEKDTRSDALGAQTG
jgi:hypothetical protein